MELGTVYDEGTVLCLSDRLPLGRIEEVFGPITAPLYALRYTGAVTPLSDSVSAGSQVFAVEKHAVTLEPEVVKAQQVHIEA